MGDLFDLFIRETKFKLIRARFNSIPAGESRANMNVARLSEICRIKDFIGRRICKDRFGVDTSLPD